DLAATINHRRERDRQLRECKNLCAELKQLNDDAAYDLLNAISDLLTDGGSNSLEELMQRGQALLEQVQQSRNALARREAMLAGLASLGYEVREGMATAWAETGKVVLQKTAAPGYGVELGGSADAGRMQIRA